MVHIAHTIEPALPPKEGEDLDGIWDIALSDASLTRRREHIFRYRWLKQALSPAEYADTQHLTIDILQNLYPEIHDGGPHGITQHRSATRMLDILKATNTQAAAFVEDLIDTHINISTLITTTENNYRTYEQHWYTMSTDNIMIDTNGWTGDLAKLRKKLITIGIPKVARPTSDTLFASSLDVHATLINMAPQLREDSEMQEIITRHDTFTDKYQLI